MLRSGRLILLLSTALCLSAAQAVPAQEMAVKGAEGPVSERNIAAKATESLHGEGLLLAQNDAESHLAYTTSARESLGRARRAMEALHQYTGKSASLKGYRLFDFSILDDAATVKARYKAAGWQMPELASYSDLPWGINVRRAFFNDYVGFLLRHNLRVPRTFAVPVVYRKGGPYRSRVYNVSLPSGLCAGQGIIAAYVREQCHGESAWYSLIENPMPPEPVARQGVYQGLPGQVARNGLQQEAGSLSIITMARLLGFLSRATDTAFREPPSLFDRHLYARGLSSFVGTESFASLGPGCSVKAPAFCNLSFVGPNVAKALEGSTNPLFILPDGGYGLPVNIDHSGNFWLQAGPTLFSGESYKNHPALTAMELYMLKDLGYKVDVGEFFGSAHYAVGTAEQPLKITVNEGFGAYDAAKGVSRKGVPSHLPLGVGLHVMSDYSEVLVNADLLTVGAGALGVRLEGEHNTLNVPFRTDIVSNGEKGAGIAVTYGRDMQLNVDGSVVASGPGGVAVLADFGSNLYSDLVEYRGSWQASSTLENRELPLPDKVRGPLISRLNITGQLSGSKAALFIAPSALVREVNFAGDAYVEGRIVSLFTPEITSDGRIIVHPHVDPEFRAPTVQIPGFPAAGSLREQERFVRRQLNTVLHFGAEREQIMEPYAADVELKGDPESEITVDGDIIGRSFILRVLDGITRVNGTLQVRRLYLDGGQLSLDAGGRSHQLNRLVMDRGTALDLVNGEPDRVEVVNGIAVGHQAAIRVDAGSDGRMLDTLEVKGDFRVRDTQLSLEPGLSYDALKRLAASPMDLLRFVTTFVDSANESLKAYNVSVRFPEHLWDSTGAYGRELRCTARGCRIGRFVKNCAAEEEELSTQNYLLSIGGLLILVAGTLLYFNMYRLRNRLRR